MDNPQQLIGEHKEKISAVLATYPQEDCNCNPIHWLLSVKPLSRVEIPLDILEMLTFGFDINEISWRDIDGFPCITVAIRNRHYAAVRWLVEHGTNCVEKDIILGDGDFDMEGCTPIAWLASYSNVPLDLFDILKTSDNLNSEYCEYLPLHTALSHGHTESALHLIILGANVMHIGSFQRLPVQYYIETYTKSYHAELFTSMMTSCSRDLLCIICILLIETKIVQDYDMILKMLQQLLQRLILDQPMSLMIHFETESDSDRDFGLSNEYIVVGIKLNQDGVYSGVISVRSLYLLSLLLFHLDCDISFFPETFQSHPQYSESS